MKLTTNWNFHYIFSALMTAAVAVSMWFYYDNHRSQDTVIATPSNEVRDLPKVDVPIDKPLKVYSGGAKLKKKLGLPADVAQDDKQHVLASSKVDCDKPQTITSVLNTETMEVKTYDRLDPLPWLAKDDHGVVGMYAVLKNGMPTVSVHAHRGLFSIKAVHFVGMAGLDRQINGTGKLDSQIGIGAEYRF